MASRIALRSFALLYLGLLLLIPVCMVFFKAFEDGVANAWQTVTAPESINAFKLTLITVGIAVPLNTVFGVVCTLVLVRQRFRGKAFLNTLIDLPFAMSPVVIGLTLVAFVIAFGLSLLMLDILQNVEKFQGYLSGEIDMTLFVQLLIGSLGMAVTGALIPALMAARVDPIILINRGQS